MQVFAFKGKASAPGMTLPGLNCFSLKNIVSPQLGRIMKLIGILLLAACLQVSAKGLTQTINLSAKDAPFIDIIKSIERQTNYAFFYKVSWLNEAKKVTIKAVNMPLKEALDICFKEQPFAYSISGKNITIIPKSNENLNNENGRVVSAPIDIHGKVVDEYGRPIAGVTVTVKGTRKQAITDESGEFVLPGVEENAVLSFSSVNMDPFTINVSGQKEILAKMKTKTSELDEVQIIAYGQTTKRLQTGNVSTVKGKEIENLPVNNLLVALTGRVPGIFIEQSNGLPGSGVKVRIQGENSLRMGNEPLYIVDGVPYSSQLLPNLGSVLGTSGGSTNGSPFSFLNLSDVESVEILKDADATAIYGSRAANGAVLITTKKGKAGRTKFELNIQTGWGKVTRKLDLLNTRQYLDMRYEAINNDGLSVSSSNNWDLRLWDTLRYTDWQKELIGGTAKFSNFQLSTSGGNANTQYLLAGGYRKETTVFNGDFSDTKASFHFNINNTSANQKFKVQLSSNYMVDNNHLSNTDFTSEAIKLAPNAPGLYNSDGTLNWHPNQDNVSTFQNPLRRLYNTYHVKTNNLISNLNIGYKLFSYLEIRSNLGYTTMQVRENQIYPLIYNTPEERPNSIRAGLYGNNNVNSWVIEPQAEYKRQIGKGKVEGLVGMTFQESDNNGQQLLGQGFNNDEVIEDIKSAANVRVTSSVAFKYKYSAAFARINYNLNDKYIVNLTARRDGSSRFGAKTQLHNFGSAGFAWLFSKESFVSNSMTFLSFGKLRFSYGTTGNDQIGDYKFLNLYGPLNYTYQGVTGLAPAGLPNPYLQWEETKKLQGGIDFGLFKDRILLGVNYYRNRSSNQLLAHPLPVLTGFSFITDNLPATIENSGWELYTNMTIAKSADVSWSINSNLTVPKNKLLKFPDLEASGYATSFFVGEPTTIQVSYKYLGVNSSTGVYEFSDGRGGVTSQPDTSSVSRIAHINTSPQYYGGINSSLQYRGFSIDVFFQFVKQKGSNYYFGFLPGEGNGGFGNQPTTVLDRWQKPGDQASIQKYNSDFNLYNQYSNIMSSDAAFTDASYIRLKTLSVSWQVPKNFRDRMHLQNAVIYIQGQNLLTFTNYKGLDPETKSSMVLPPLSMLTFGLQLGL